MSSVNLRIRKRSGIDVEYDPEKIAQAIRNANTSVTPAERVSEHLIQEIVRSITEKYAGQSVLPTVEGIQDDVIFALMKHGAYRLANNYIVYRYQHASRRNMSDLDKKIIAIVGGISAEAKDENSNKNTDILPTQRDYMAGEVSRDLTRRVLLPPDIMAAHDEGRIHFHDADYAIQKSHNCFSGSTRFITDKGLRAFSDFHDGDVVTVKDKDGILREATVHCYGQQAMIDVTLQAGRRTITITCTANHRWLLANGSETTALKVGDLLTPTVDSTAFTIENRSDAEAFTLGFVIGNGVDHYDITQVRLCGAKTQYTDIFIKAGYKASPVKDSNDIVMTRKDAIKQDFLNGRAWRFMDTRAKQLAFHGYYAADGKRCETACATADNRVLQFIQDTAPLAGYYVSSMTDVIRDTPYKDNAQLTYVHFVTHQTVKPAVHLWHVTNIQPHSKNRKQLAWCVEEPVTHTFTLEQGVVTGNCGVYNFDDMLQNGTVITGTKIDKPHKFSTACNIATQLVAQIASSSYGGQSMSLTHLAKFVNESRKTLRNEVNRELSETGVEMTQEQIDKVVELRVKKDIAAGIQTIQYQILTLMTTNGQAPFTTLFMWLGEAGDDQRLKDDLAMCIEEVLRQRLLGVKNTEGVYITPSFPKLIYVTDEDNIHETSPYFYLTYLAAQCTAKRMVPDYVSAKQARLLKKGDVYGPMGCRSFLTPDRFTDAGIGNIAKAKNYVPGQHKYYGRFNQGVVTVNLPFVAMSSGKDLGLFWKEFDNTLDLCHRALRIRHEHLLGTTSDVAPVLWQYGALARLDKGEKIDPLLYNGYSTISLGYAGLYEAVMYLTGHSHTDPEGKPLALQIMQHMNDKCAEWKADENIDYSLYGTPLESTTYKFAKALRAKFGVIENVSDHDYITNSYHVCVREPIDAFQKLSFEAEFQALSPGGAISYVEVPNLQNNIEAIVSVIQFMYDNILYAELNTKSDYCQVCGFDGEIKIIEEDGKVIWECPNCHNRDQHKMNVCRRTCGYLGTQFWNQGRTKEIRDRVLHL